MGLPSYGQWVDIINGFLISADRQTPRCIMQLAIDTHLCVNFVQIGLYFAKADINQHKSRIVFIALED